MAEKWRIKEICKSCEYRRRCDTYIAKDYSNTMCVYTAVTDQFRETPPTDERCDYYRKQKGKLKSLCEK